MLDTFVVSRLLGFDFNLHVGYLDEDIVLDFGEKLSILSQIRSS